ncbi:carboxypeptidase regulatory-like domain-containing protein [Luedemannella flava]|uniref:carboxypeptidase regulatory-like domain-containing protein n=1 Tax=Luedemannella flava TaxID=349316 RepID=UPI0031DDCC12
MCADVRTDVEAAQKEAQACGKRVEVLADRTETAQTFANSDGTMTVEESVTPVRVRRGSSWVPVDTTLAKTATGFAPKATVLPMTFSGGGSGPFAKLANGSHELALSWSGKLPAPTLFGDTAVYRNVLPDVDLRVTATATGFSEVFVVKTPEAAANPKLASLKFGLSTKGVTLRATTAGGLAATDSKGKAVFTAPAPLMWDSTAAPDDNGGTDAQAPSTKTGAAPADGSATSADGAKKTTTAGDSADQRGPPGAKDIRKAVMPVKVDSDTLVITPVQDLLKNPRAKFPIYIDPSFSGAISGNAWTTVWSKYPNSSFWRDSTALLNGSTNGTVGAGRTEDCSSCADYVIRTMFKMDITKAYKKHVTSAKFMIEQRHSWTCSPKSNAKLWLLKSDPAASTTWNKQPTWNGSYTATTAANRKVGAIHGCSGPGTIEFNATAMVAKAAATSKTVSVGLRAIDESTKLQWKRFKHSTAKLSVTYNTKPNVPATRVSDTKACATGTSRPYVLTATPVLKAQQYDADGAEESDLKTYFYWWAQGGARNETDKLTYQGGYTATAYGNVPAGKLVDGGTYVWQARSYDGVDYSDWSPTCEFTVDLTSPPTPGGIASTEYPADGAPHGGVNLAGTFTITAASPTEEITGYAYTLDSGIQPSGADYVAAQAGTYGATVTIVPKRDGVFTLRVWAKDKAGRYSTTPKTHTFTVRAGSGPATDWVFDEASGNAIDNTGHNNALTITGGTRVTGRGGQGSALSLNGSSQYAATASAVTTPHPDTGVATAVRTDQSFTVSARVRISTTGGTEQKGIVTASGSRTSAFTLGYSGPDNKWRFAIAGSDVDAPTVYAVLSNATATANKWTHLTGSYNASTGQVQLYVNGVLQTATATVSGGFNATGSVVVGRRLWAGAYTGYFGGLVDDVRLYNFVETATRVGELAAPLPAKVTFPNGTSVNAGQPITVVFDGGGDENVTSFNYAVDSTNLTLTATPGTPGGTVTKTIATTAAKTYVLYAVANDANWAGPRSQFSYTATSAASIYGTVVNGSAGSVPLPGASVGLGPLGQAPTLQTTAGSAGEYGFSALAVGEYTLSGSYGGRCGLTGSTDIMIDAPDIAWDLELFANDGYTCAEQTASFAAATTTVSALTGDNVTSKITLPFAFPFYGQVFYEAWIDSNGYVTFLDPGGSYPYTGTGNVPQVASPNGVVAPFWDDLVVDASASVRTSLTGTGSAARFTIEWNNVYRKANSSQRLSFETILAPDGTVTTNYTGLDTDAEKGAAAIVGIEAPSGENGLVYSKSQPALQNGRAVVFTAPETVSLFDLSGTLKDAAGVAVVGATVSIEPLGLTAVTGTGGTYQFNDLPADSYGVSAKVGTRCATVARAQVELTADTVTNLQLQPDYGGMGYACSTVASAYRSDTTVFNVGTTPFTGDEARAPMTFPFPIKYHGTSYTSGWVDTNGLLGMGPVPNMAVDATYKNLAMPNANVPNGVLAPFWDDLDVDSSASVRTLSTGSAPNRTFVVEWRNVKMYPSLARTTFEILMHENGEITFAYAGATTTAAQRADMATIGIEAGSGTAASQYSFEEDVLTGNPSIRYTPAAPGTVSGTLTTAVTGTIVAGATITLTPAGLTSNTPLTTTTDSSGNYQFTSVPVGEYLVNASTNDGRCAGQAAEQFINHKGGTSDIDLSVMTAGDEGGYTCTYGTQTFVPAAGDTGATGDYFRVPYEPDFPIKLYGEVYTKAWISDDGVITFNNPDDRGGIPWLATPIPSAGPDGEPNAAVYPFWLDWELDSQSSLRTEETGSAPNRRWIVEWRNVKYAGDANRRVTFEAIFDENGAITFAYSGIDTAYPIERGSISTVGIEDGQGSIAFQYANRDAWLSSGQGVKFLPGTPGPGTVYGAVTCQGDAVAGATVAVGGQQATTAADGTYSISNVTAGTYAVVGTVPSGTCVGSKVLPVTVGTGTDRMIDFELTATAANSGYTLVEQATTFVPANTTVLTIPKDDSYASVTFPFPVKLYGQTYTSGKVADNGFITFATTSGDPGGPQAIPSAPSTGKPGAAVYPFWYDWVVDSQSSVRTASTSDAAPNRKFIVEWRNVRSFQEPGIRVSFEVIFEESGAFTFAYTGIDGTSTELGSGATIGIENAAGTAGLQYTFRSPVLKIGNGVRISPPTS